MKISILISVLLVVTVQSDGSGIILKDPKELSFNVANIVIVGEILDMDCLDLSLEECEWRNKFWYRFADLYVKVNAIIKGYISHDRYVSYNNIAAVIRVRYRGGVPLIGTKVITPLIDSDKYDYYLTRTKYGLTPIMSWEYLYIYDESYLDEDDSYVNNEHEYLQKRDVYVDTEKYRILLDSSVSKLDYYESYEGYDLRLPSQITSQYPLETTTTSTTNTCDCSTTTTTFSTITFTSTTTEKCPNICCKKVSKDNNIEKWTKQQKKCSYKCFEQCY